MSTVSAPASTFAASLMIPAAERSVAYGEVLVKDIPAEKFGHMPHPSMNHPLFNIGHLALYPNRVLTMIGRSDLVKEKAGWDKLFAAGCPCVEQDGRDPSKDEVVAHFLERSRAAIAAMANVTDDVLDQQNPIEGRMRELFPKVGHAVLFLLNNHPMMHLGQISAWRRAVGLPSVM